MRRLTVLAIVLVLLGYLAIPYARALSLIVRAARMGGTLEAVANNRARGVTIEQQTTIPTRHGNVPARFYRPDGGFDRTVLLVPGIHAMGIDEPRLTALAKDMAGSGIGVMSIVAAGRSSIRDRAAFVLSFGGHGDLPRVIRYLCTGEAPHVEGIEIHPPHDYGVAVGLYGVADRVVPAEQVEPLREGIRTFLWASQLTLVDQKKADAMFAK